jgi:hypothetical protein
MNENEATTAVGTEVLFENERIRVWVMLPDPGETCAPHRHVHDHVILHAEPATIRSALHHRVAWSERVGRTDRTSAQRARPHGGVDMSARRNSVQTICARRATTLVEGRNAAWDGRSPARSCGDWI